MSSVITKTQFAERLYFMLAHTGMSKSGLAAAVKMPPPRISEFLSPAIGDCDKAMEPAMIHRIAKGLGYKAGIFFVDKYVSCEHNAFLLEAEHDDSTSGLHSGIPADESLQPA